MDESISHRDRDGYVELEFNADRTQVFASIYPPKAGGRSITAKEIVDQLRAMGVQYGIRENEILKAVKAAHECAKPAKHVMVAQGILPEHGTDGQIMWKVDFPTISQPLPIRPEGILDYFALDPARRVKAGQLLAEIIPARPGIPGKTLTTLQPVRAYDGKEITLKAGEGVRVAEDKLSFYAGYDGFAVYQRDHLCVLALHWYEGDLPLGDHTFPGGVVILGSVRGGYIEASGPVAIQGSAAGVTIRTHADVHLVRAARTKVMTEGNVYVYGTLLHCEINARQKLIGLAGASIVGGSHSATGGVRACSLGSPDMSQTQVLVGVDRLSSQRVAEVEKEIGLCEANIQRIGKALRPLTGLTTDSLPMQKKQLIHTLVEQRQRLEERVRALYNEKRNLMMNAKAQIAATVIVTGKVYPGVTVTIQNAATLVEETRERVLFRLGPGGKSICIEEITPATQASAL